MKLKIIVIDDEESIRDTFKWHLEDLGHDVEALPSPEYCELHSGEKCKKDVPCCDAMLVDFNMPGMNGLELLVKMAQGGCLADPRNVILMSGDTSKIDMNTVDKYGWQVMQKPLTLDALEAWLQEVKARLDNR